MNVTRPSGRTPRVCGLAASCSRAAKRIAPPRVSSSASGSASRSATLSPRSPRSRAATASSTSNVWPRTSAWWNSFCSTPRSAASSGSTASISPCASISSSPWRARSAVTTRLSSPNTRSGATRSIEGACSAMLAAVAGSSSKPSSVTSRTARRVRSGIVGHRGRGHHPDEPGLDVGAAAVRVEQVAAGQRLGHRVDREVARGEVGVDVALQGHEVDVPAVAGADDAPGPERARQLEGGAAGGARDRARRLARVAGQRDVDVVGRPAEQAVAHGAADHPRLAARQGLPCRLQRLRAQRCSRGTRGERPHVTS